MILIKPIQDLTHEIDAAYAALQDEPQSKQKRQRYDQLSAKMEMLISNARKQVAEKPNQ